MSSNLNAQMTMKLRDRFSRNGRRLRDSMRGIRKDSRDMGKGFKSAARDAAEMARKDIQAARSKQGLINEFKKGQSAVKQSRLEYAAARTKMQALSKEIKAAEKPSKKLQAAFKKAKQDTDRLGRAFKQNTQTAQQNKKALDAVGIKANRLSSNERELAATVDRATAEMNKQTQAARRQAAEYQKLERRKQAVLRLTNRERQRRDSRLVRGAAIGAAGVGGMVAGRQLLRPVSNSVAQFASFEEQMDAVAAVARVKKGSEDYRGLNNLARELGATTSYSALEAGQGMGFLAMAGMDVAAIKASMADVLNLAKATKTDLAGTADISSNILSGFGLEPAEMTRVADVLTATTTRANVDLTMLGESMKYAAPIAKQLGVSLEETAAMAGLLGNVGIQGSMAGTSLRTIYTRLAAPAKRGKKALRELKVETKDAAGNLRSVPDVLLEIAKATEKMGSGKRAEIFKNIVGADAGSAFAALLDDKGFAVFETLLADLKDVNGESKRVATQMGDNLMGDWKSFGSAVSEVGLIFGETLNPALRDTVKTMTRWVRSTGEWLKEHPNFTKGIIFTAGALGLLLVVGGAFLTFAGSAIAVSAGLRFGMSMLGLRGRTGARGVGRMSKAIGALDLGLGKVSKRKGALDGLMSRGTLRGVLALAGAIGVITDMSDMTARKAGETDDQYARRIPAEAAARGNKADNWLVDNVPGMRKIGEWGFFDLPEKPEKPVKHEVLAGEVYGPNPLRTPQEKPVSLADSQSNIVTEGREQIRDLTEGLKLLDEQISETRQRMQMSPIAAQMNQKILDEMNSERAEVVAELAKLKQSISVSDPDVASKQKADQIRAVMIPGKIDTGARQSLQARASGGSYRSGPLLVGERGPELKYANEGGYIAHNDNLKRMVRMSDRIRRAARIGAVAGAIAAPMSSVAAAAPILPTMPATMAPTGATGPKFEISIQFGDITANEPDIANVIEEAVASALRSAMADAQNLLSD
ncbi:phage tail tape measure protein [Pseudovibrio ascidiaceicola]|uniref:phage tail tape measure protein n=1 Tax=Pseudovibrio ascidiaceicola TaxID=285279 RepID=UPI003D3622F1